MVEFFRDKIKLKERHRGSKVPQRYKINKQNQQNIFLYTRLNKSFLISQQYSERENK